MELIFKDILEQIEALDGAELYCFYASQVTGLIATILGIITGQLNKAKHILIKEIVLNSLCGAASILVGGVNGALTALLASALAAVIYFYYKRSIPMPKWLCICSYITFFVLGVITFIIWSGRNWYDFFPIICSMSFVYSLTAKNPGVYRFCFMVNSSLWIVYYFKITAYSSILTQFFFLVSILIAVVRFDIPYLIKKDGKRSS